MPVLLLWLARHALVSGLEAQVQQGWLEDGRTNVRSWVHSWHGARQQAVSGEQASPVPQTCSVRCHGPPVREGSAPLL